MLVGGGSIGLLTTFPLFFSIFGLLPGGKLGWIAGTKSGGEGLGGADMIPRGY